MEKAPVADRAVDTADYSAGIVEMIDNAQTQPANKTVKHQCNPAA